MAPVVSLCYLCAVFKGKVFVPACSFDGFRNCFVRCVISMLSYMTALDLALYSDSSCFLPG